MNSEELAENSDSSDEDYVPDKKTEVVSEEDSDGDAEDDPVEEEGHSNSKRRTKNSKKHRKRQKTDKNDDDNLESPKQISEEEKKKVEEDVWADFMRDTGFQSKGNVSKTVDNNKPKSTTSETSSVKSKVESKTRTITQVFEFAGEEVTVQKQITENSPLDAKLNQTTSTKMTRNDKKGIGSILSQLGKKPKISTLEKSKLDWDQFKREENIEEELQTHNKGRDGYLEKQDFLNRADLRRFEIEKKIRTNERNKRFNNSS